MRCDGLTLVETARAVNICAEFYQLGGRPVIAAHLTGLTSKMARDVYREVMKVPPPRGMLPSSPRKLLTNRAIQSEASSLAIMLRSMRHIEPQGARLLAAYRLYRQTHKNPAIDINRAWSLLQMLNTGEVELAPCRNCGAEILLSPECDPLTTCAVCAESVAHHSLRPTTRLPPHRPCRVAA